MSGQLAHANLTGTKSINRTFKIVWPDEKVCVTDGTKSLVSVENSRSRDAFQHPNIDLAPAQLSDDIQERRLHEQVRSDCGSVRARDELPLSIDGGELPIHGIDERTYDTLVLDERKKLAELLVVERRSDGTTS